MIRKPVRIARSAAECHPRFRRLWSGMVSAVLLSEASGGVLYDLIARRRFTPSSGTPDWGSTKVGSELVSVSSQDWGAERGGVSDSLPEISGTQPRSSLTVVRWAGALDADYLWGIGDGSVNRDWRVRFGSSSLLRVECAGGSYVCTFDFSDGRPHAVLAKCPGGNIQDSSWYVDGRVAAYDSSTDNVPNTGGGQYHIFGKGTGGSGPEAGEAGLSLVCQWARELSGSEARLATQSPFGQFRPTRRVTYTVPLSLEEALAQYSFRFRDDDGSESAATWLAAQDINISRAKDDPARVRIQMDQTGDLAGKLFQLEYRKKDSGAAWRKVE